MAPIVIGIIILAFIAVVLVGLRRRQRKGGQRMSGEAKKLQKAFLLKEQTEGFLANLEKLNAEGNISTEQYEVMKKDYDQRLAAASSEVTGLKVQLSHQLEEAKRDLDVNTWELGKLETRFKVGELPLENYKRLEQKLRRRVEKLEGRIAELDGLTKAGSSADIGTLPKKVAVGLSTSGMAMPSISAEAVSTPLGIASLVVGGVMLIATLFLPWISFFGMGVSVMQVHGGLAALCLIVALTYAGATFLTDDKIRGRVHVGVSAGAFIGLLFGLFQIMQEAGEFGELVIHVLGAGFWFFMIAAVAGIIVGVFELR